MKQIILLLAITLSSIAQAQTTTIEWSYAPNGYDINWTWDFDEFTIPEGCHIDSVYANLDRPGFLPEFHDYIFTFNVGTVYDQNITVEPWVYWDINESLYDRWIDISAEGYEGPGIVRVGVPSSGMIWDSVGLAMTCYDVNTNEPIIDVDQELNTSTAGLDDLNQDTFKAYPNPMTNTLTIEATGDVVILDMAGKLVYQVESQGTFSIDVSNFRAGAYFVKVGSQTLKVIKQ